MAELLGLCDISSSDAVEKCLKADDVWTWMKGLNDSVPGIKSTTYRKTAIKNYILNAGQKESISVNRL